MIWKESGGMDSLWNCLSFNIDETAGACVLLQRAERADFKTYRLLHSGFRVSNAAAFFIKTKWIYIN